MSLLDPLSHALAALIAAAHAGLTQLGADPTAGITWLACIAVVVVAVRVAHASARARPQIQEMANRYRNRKDPESARRHLAERRRIAAEHGVPRLGFLPVLLQLPIWIALYHLLADVAAGAPVGAMGPDLAGSLGAATLLACPWPSAAISEPEFRTSPWLPAWPWSRQRSPTSRRSTSSPPTP